MLIATATLSAGGGEAAELAADRTGRISRIALKPPSAGVGQAAQLSATPIKLKVLAQCHKDATVFRVVNAGESWPKAGRFKIYRTGDKSMVSQRRMRLAPGQKASFKVKKKFASGEEMGLWVEPGWYSRKFTYDARVRCP